jgi:hypothetical protein
LVAMVWPRCPNADRLPQGTDSSEPRPNASSAWELQPCGRGIVPVGMNNAELGD